MNYDVFISHASEDKVKVARPLADKLRELGLRVWLDEFELRLGDSLRRSIDYGLAQSRFGVVILSPAFFRKEWPQRELDALVTRELRTGKVVLPIWHNVTHDEILEYSPILADRLGVSTNRGLEYVAQQIFQVINEPPHLGTIREPLPIKKRRLSFRKGSVFLLGPGVITLGILAAIGVSFRREQNKSTYRMAIHTFYGPARFVTPENKCGPRLFTKAMDIGSLTEEQLFILEDLNGGQLQYDDLVRIQRCGNYWRALDGGGGAVYLTPIRDSATEFRLLRPQGVGAEIKEAQQVVFGVENRKNFITGANELHAKSDWIGNIDNIFAFIER